MSRPLKVFLSHAHADADAVRALYARLVADGVDAWLDKEKLFPGQDWEREIRKAVRDADVVIVCLSKQFNQRGYRQKEVRIALDEAEMMPEGEIFIIPARLEECENLESLRKWQWVDLFADDGYEKLLGSLRLRAQKVDAKLQQKKSGISSVFKKPPEAPKKDIPSKKQRKSVKTEYIVALIGAIATLLGALISSPLIEKWTATATPEPTKTEIVLPSATSTPTVLPTNTPAPTATSTPIITPTKTFTPTPIASATSTPDPFADGFELVSMDETVYRGGEASATIRTYPDTYCTLTFFLPSGTMSSSAGVGACTTDKDGVCEWTWDIRSNVNPGIGNIVIIVGEQQESYPIKIE